MKRYNFNLDIVKTGKVSRKKLNNIEMKSNLVKRTKRRGIFFIGKILIILLIISATIGIGLSYKIISASKKIFVDGNVSIVDQIKKVVTSEQKLKGENEGRINVLLLGEGGEGHEGENLTDTIIVASFKPETKDVALLSIPRDLYVKIPTIGYNKINAANAFGEQYGYEGGGIKLAQDTIENTIGVPIHYYIRIDFDGFKKIIDNLGGIDIEVENSFVDYLYPTENYGYETIRFERGLQHMDGDTALKYARSRYAAGVEGGDFARARRQQKVLAAVKEKAFSLNTMLNPKKISNILNNLGNHIITNFEPSEIIRLAELGKNVNTNNILNIVLDDSEDGLLYSNKINIDGVIVYVLQPRDGDFSEIRDLAKNIFEKGYIKNERANIEVQNGTDISWAAKEMANRLQGLGFNIADVTSAEKTDFTQTLIYNYSDGKKPYTLKALMKELNAQVVPPPAEIKMEEKENKEKPDFIVIIGKDHAQ